MPQRVWRAKRGRQYELIKERLERRGNSEDLAEAIAARTVNQQRAHAGESKQASRTPTKDLSSGRRGGLRSHQDRGAALATRSPKRRFVVV